ncbi:MAG: hypothetical protein ACJAV9_000807 [Urechidicola sp.]|jgi:hypothetical protein
MLKKTLIILLVLVTSIGFSQEKTNSSISTNESTEITNLKGQIVNGFDKKPLQDAHVFNLNTVRGTVTDDDGSFTIPTQLNDTIFLSHVGFQSIKIKITNDLLKGNELEIALFQKAENIAEVTVKSTKLIGVLEIDARNIPQDKFTRIHINGLPQTYEVGRPNKKTYSSPLDAIFHPMDFVYNLFGKKPKQLRRLKKMREESEIRDILDSKVNREFMLEYLELSKQELNELLDECNYSEYFIKKASDIQVIEAVLECYENHKALKKGSTERKK